VDFLTHADLTGRLRGLVILLGDKISPDQSRAVEKLIDTSEFGAALEMLANWLAEHETPLPEDLRRDFERLATQIGNHDRVMDPLRLCPPEK
jgi:hypothetical protein